MAATAQAPVAETAARRRFTVDEVYRMVEAGILSAEERLELFDGELRTMSPQGTAHSAYTAELRERLRVAYADDAHVRDHSPMRVTEWDLLEPDIAVVSGPARAYRGQLPTARDVRLVVEIAASSRRRDLEKATVYARGGVAEYWLVDIDARTVTRFSQPRAEGYARVQELAPGERLQAPGTAVGWTIETLFD